MESMVRRSLYVVAGLCALMVFSPSFWSVCRAQTTTPSLGSSPREEHPAAAAQGAKSQNTIGGSIESAPDYDTSIGVGLFKRIGKDQIDLWTFPRHLSWEDADIIVPFGMGLGALLPTDSDVSKHLSNSPSRINNSNKLANYGIGAMAGVTGGIYVWGQLTHDPHKKETGFLAGEAGLNAVIIAEALKYSFGRTRPLDQPLYAGDFWHGGTSMPSEHSAVAWAIASVFAHEYPGPLPSFLAYGLASSISMARITGKQHFPSDVFVGSVIGWYVGKQAYRAHHDPELDGSEWQSYGEFQGHGSNSRNSSLGTTFVPLNSWIYPAMKRLIALGYIQSEFMDMQPWSRLECARLVEEAGERIATSADTSQEVDGLYAVLAKEFASDVERIGGSSSEGTSARVESAYTRVMGISGTPINDSYHFGQTVLDDYGRPFGEGVNAIAGGSAWVTQGRFALYASGEYEYAPSAPSYSAAVNNAIAVMDNNPVQAGTFPSTNQFRLMDTYVSSNQANWIFSFGKQSLWWSPDYSNAFLMSNNAAPIYMFRVSRLAPFEIPWISKVLGPMKIDAFIGKLSGNEFPPRPVLHGEKFSFKPSPNLEFGFTRTGEMGGVGRPITPRAVWLSYTSLQNSVFYGPINPGKRTSGFDMYYRIPYLRNWLTIYTDSLTTDNITAFADFPRAAFAPGIYLTRFPKLSKLDLHLEAAYTDTPKVWTPPRQPLAAIGQFNYWDSFYHDLYTNNGFLIGSPVGREGHSYQAWTTYHVSSLNWLQFGYRHSSAAPDFIPGGGNINDASVSANWWIRGSLNATALVQWEKWNYPILAPVRQTNWVSSLGINFYPESWKWGH
jgi:Capsule assembly protein Wzi/PAP2 superfamily